MAGGVTRAAARAAIGAANGEASGAAAGESNNDGSPDDRRGREAVFAGIGDTGEAGGDAKGSRVSVSGSTIWVDIPAACTPAATLTRAKDSVPVGR